MSATSHTPDRNRSGFSLIELIGVLAILAILASVVAPNAIKSIDRAAVSAEVESLHVLAGQMKLLVRDAGAPPSSATWVTSLAAYSDLSPYDVGFNRRDVARVYVADPATTPSERAMILSSMRPDLALPTSANLNNTTRFSQVWDTADGEIPPSSSWGGWNNWNAVSGAEEYLVIERINLASLYRGDLQNLTISLNNNGPASASYNLVDMNGVNQGVVSVPAGASVVLPGLHPRERVNLYSDPSGAVLDYSYVLSDSGKTFDFDGANWTPQ